MCSYRARECVGVGRENVVIGQVMQATSQGEKICRYRATGRGMHSCSIGRICKTRTKDGLCLCLKGHTHTDIHADTDTGTDTDIHTYTNTHTRARAHRHRHRHTHIYTHTRSHTLLLVVVTVNPTRNPIYFRKKDQSFFDAAGT